MAADRLRVFTGGVATLLIVCYCCTAASSSTVPSPQGSVCPENQYWDHGTENCEPCTDICKDAEYKKTVDECQRYCPATFKALLDGQQKPAVSIQGSQSPQNPPPASGSATTSGFEAAVGTSIGAVIVAAAIIGAIVVVAIRQRTKRGKNGPHTVDVAYKPAVQEEDGAQAANERHSHSRRLMRFWDSMWFRSGAASHMHDEESRAGQDGPQEMVLSGSGTNILAPTCGSYNWPQQQTGRSEAQVHGSRSSGRTGPSSRPIYKPSANPVAKPSENRSRNTSPTTGRVFRPSGPFMTTPTLL